MPKLILFKPARYSSAVNVIRCCCPDIIGGVVVVSCCNDARSATRGRDVMFEDVDQWLPALQLQVVQLGKQLQGSPTLPFCEVLEELEELLATLAIVQSLERQGDQSRSAVAGAAWSRGWTVRCFLEVGIAHAALLEAFMEVLDRWAGKAPEKLLHVLSSASYVLMAWTKTAVQ